MSALYLAANQVFGTTFGHIQLVFDPDGDIGNGNERELEVQPSSVFETLFGNPLWEVSPDQPFAVPDGALTRLSEPLDTGGRDAADVWALLRNARDFFAGEYIEYILGLSAVSEGQNSNTYIVTMAHVAGLDIASEIGGFLDSPDFSAFPGQNRNILFEMQQEDTIFPLRLMLEGTGADDIIRGGRSFDEIMGMGGHDTLFGDDGNDILKGGAGRDRLAGGGRDDTLEGGGGRDRLLGQAGADHITGGAGNDILKGGRGADSFIFDGLRDEGRDRIADFEAGRDTIRIDGLSFDDLTVTGGPNARVTLESGTEIVLRGVTADSIDEDAFLFVLA